MLRTKGVEDVLVSVLTPSIPERSVMLRECMHSVAAQTVGCWEHLIKVDKKRAGCAVTMNELARAAEGQWLLPLADDDLLLPGALASLLPWTNGTGTIVYAPPLVWGREEGPFLQTPPHIPSFALVHRDLWFELAGYDETLRREEDRDLWTRAAAQGIQFRKVVGAPTWVYRHHEGNKSFANGVAS